MRSRRSRRWLLVLLALPAAWLLGAQSALAAGPTTVYAPVIQGRLAEGQHLAATEGVWSNTSVAPSTFSYQWERCSAGGCIAIPWAVESGYVPIRADVGSVLVVRVSATDASGHTATVTSAAVGPIVSDGATAYYVDGGSTGGPCSDSYSTVQAQSTSRPWCSITHAVSALAATSTAADIIVRRCGTCAAGNAGYEQPGDRAGNQIDLTGEDPTAPVTIEPYGDGMGEADNVLVAGFWFDNTSNFSVDGLNLGDPANSYGQSGAGCPYIAIDDLMEGNLPSADYCQPATSIELEGGTSNVALNDDNSTVTLRAAATAGSFCGAVRCPISDITLYGDRFHNPGLDCTVYKGMTLSSSLTGGDTYTSIPISAGSDNPPTTIPAGASTTIPAGAFITVMTGTPNNPGTYDQTVQTNNSSTAIGPDSSSIPLKRPGLTLASGENYPAGSAVVADSCAGSSPDVLLHADTGEGVGTAARFENWTVEHTQYDHSNWAAVAIGGNNINFEYDTFDYIEQEDGNDLVSHADGFADEGLTNSSWSDNLMYMVTEPWVALCNGNGFHTPCGSNLTIDNNVITAAPVSTSGNGLPAFQVSNNVGGTNYAFNNTLWSGHSGNVNGSFEIGWTDDCCNGQSGQPAPGKWYIENNIFDVLTLTARGSTGNAEQDVAQEDYNLITNFPAVPNGTGAHDIVGTGAGFATPIGSNCAAYSYDDTEATDLSCTTGADGSFNAAVLRGSPAIGAGTDGGNIPPGDFLGNTRSVPYDIGALQFNVDSQPPATVTPVAVPPTNTPTPTVGVPARNLINPSGMPSTQGSLVLTVTSKRPVRRGAAVSVRCDVRCHISVLGAMLVRHGRRAAHAVRAAHLRVLIFSVTGGSVIRVELPSRLRAMLRRYRGAVLVMHVVAQATGWGPTSKTVTIRLRLYL